jgi:ABC-2 type transport system ATP-binding protein
VIDASHTERQTTLIVRSDGPVVDPVWTIEPTSLEDVVLAYMARGSRHGSARASQAGAAT